MPVLDRVELTATGVLNDRPFRVYGSISVDNAKGVKVGTFTYDPPPSGVVIGPDPMIIITSRCFVGARWSGERPSVGPFELLGREFTSLRVTTESRFGTMSLGEDAWLEGRTLHSELVGVGKLKRPDVHGVGPLRELITVGGGGTLVTRGSYSLLTGRNRKIPIRYVHFYQSSKPDRRLFRRYRGRTYLLRVTPRATVSGNKLRYETHSTIRQVGPD
jgi:hypothetical protein